MAGAGEHVDLLSRTGMQWHDLATATEQEKADPDAIAARAPKPDAIAQLLFTSGTTGEPKGVLHRFDALTRAAAMEIEHLRLGRDDVLFIPSPLAHQTGFLYGMWEAFVLGATQLLQDVWEPVRAARALRAWGGSFVQAATPFLTDLVRVVEEGEPRPRGAAHLRRHRRRGAARAGRARDVGPRHGGLRRLGLDRVLPRHARGAQRRAREALGHRRARARRDPDPHHRRRGHRARRRARRATSRSSAAACSRATSTART